MFAQVSHPYLLQVFALWVSFVPAAGIAVLIAGAQFERSRRSRLRVSIFERFIRPID